MDIYNIVRDKILDVVINNYNEIDTQTLNLITCEQPKNLKFGDLSTNVLMIIKNKIHEDINEIKTLIINKLEPFLCLNKLRMLSLVLLILF